MTNPITITNPAALEQGQRVARERAATMPVFVLKARDNLATTAICAYYAACICHGLKEQADQVELALAEIMDWREANRDKCKFPDHNHVPAGHLGSGSEGPAAPPFPPEIPPHIQFLRQLPAAKAGQSIEEAAADEIRRLREECDRYKNIILANAFPLTPDPDAVAALTAELAALAERERIAKDALEAAHNWMGYAFRYCDSTIRDMYDEVLPKVSSAISALSPAPSPAQAGEGATGGEAGDELASQRERIAADLAREYGRIETLTAYHLRQVALKAIARATPSTERPAT